MSDSEILRNECIQLAHSIEESFSSICAIWDEVGIHNQNTRETIKMEYYKSCKDVVLAHMKRMYDEEDEVIHE
jgi:singapore isolate B (sub-type 7) whole genome shotgun sequence assembly, scaffold_11